jgi:hypothetical protein
MELQEEKAPLFCYPKRCLVCRQWIHTHHPTQEYFKVSKGYLHLHCRVNQAPATTGPNSTKLSPVENVAIQSILNSNAVSIPPPRLIPKSQVVALDHLPIFRHSVSAPVTPAPAPAPTRTGVNFAMLQANDWSLYKVIISMPDTRIEDLIATGLSWENVQEMLDKYAALNQPVMPLLQKIGFTIQHVRQLCNISTPHEMAAAIQSGRIKLSKADWGLLRVTSTNYKQELGITFPEWMNL